MKRLILVALLSLNCSGSQVSPQQRLELCINAASLAPAVRDEAAKLGIEPAELAETLCRTGKLVKDVIAERLSTAGQAAR